MRERKERKVTIIHPLLWVIEPLEADPTLVIRAMFGGKAVYVRGRFVLYLTAKAEPWCGVLVPCDRPDHASLLQDFPTLVPHSILPKWLYLSESIPSFERDAAALVRAIRQGDARIGIEPAERRKRSGVRRQKPTRATRVRAPRRPPGP